MADEAAPRVIIRRKKGGHAAYHGGAWKVAYADFVTAMMALFMVLWLLTQADLKLRSQIAQYFRNAGVMPGSTMLSEEKAEHSREPKIVGSDIIVVQGQGEEEKLEGQAKQIEQAVKDAAKENPELAGLQDQVMVQVTEAGLSIQFVDKGRNMLFDLSSAELKPAVVEVLKRMGTLLGSMPNPLQIGGHTDARPYPPQTHMTNWELSFRRADNARRVLEGNGLRPGQVKSVMAFADRMPLVPENPLADENRRLSVLAERQQPAPAKYKSTGGNDVVVMPPDSLPGAAAHDGPPADAAPAAAPASPGAAPATPTAAAPVAPPVVAPATPPVIAPATPPAADAPAATP
jgi:chemotaxis protein MotB